MITAADVHLRSLEALTGARMPWNNPYCPQAMAHRRPDVRSNAIEIPNALMEETTTTASQSVSDRSRKGMGVPSRREYRIARGPDNYACPDDYAMRRKSCP